MNMSIRILFTATFFLSSISFAQPQSPCQHNLKGDLNKDCVVNLADLSDFASNWLIDCSDIPIDPSCIAIADDSLIFE